MGEKGEDQQRKGYMSCEETGSSLFQIEETLLEIIRGVFVDAKIIDLGLLLGQVAGTHGRHLPQLQAKIEEELGVRVQYLERAIYLEIGWLAVDIFSVLYTKKQFSVFGCIRLKNQ